MTEADVLNRYKNAFRTANPGKEAPHITKWGSGWYKVDGRTPMRRLKEFVEWSERLEARAALDSQPQKGE